MAHLVGLMQPLFIVKDLPFSDIKGMLSEVSLNEISLFSLCDRLGRGSMSEKKAEEEKTVWISLLKSTGNIPEQYISINLKWNEWDNGIE